MGGIETGQGQWRQSSPGCVLCNNKDRWRLQITLVSKVGERDTTLEIRMPKGAVPFARLY